MIIFCQRRYCSNTFDWMKYISVKKGSLSKVAFITKNTKISSTYLTLGDMVPRNFFQSTTSIFLTCLTLCDLPWNVLNLSDWYSRIIRNFGTVLTALQWGESKSKSGRFHRAILMFLVSLTQQKRKVKTRD